MKDNCTFQNKEKISLKVLLFYIFAIPFNVWLNIRHLECFLFFFSLFFGVFYFCTQSAAT